MCIQTYSTVNPAFDRAAPFRFQGSGFRLLPARAQRGAGKHICPSSGYLRFSINLVLNLVESPVFTVAFSKQKVRGLLAAHKYYAHACEGVLIDKLCCKSYCGETAFCISGFSNNTSKLVFLYEIRKSYSFIFVWQSVWGNCSTWFS
jgi:hypothetical protein